MSISSASKKKLAIWAVALALGGGTLIASAQACRWAKDTASAVQLRQRGLRFPRLWMGEVGRWLGLARRRCGLETWRLGLARRCGPCGLERWISPWR